MNIILSYEYVYIILLLVCVALIFHILAVKRAKKRIMLFSNYETLEKVMKKKSSFKNNLPLILRALAFIFLVLAVSHFILEFTTSAADMDVVFVIDNSGTMFSTDNGSFSPHKLGAVKESMLRFLDMVPKDVKMAVVSFGGTTKITSTELTDNRKGVRLAVESVGIPVYECSAMENVFLSASTILAVSDRKKVVILLTDGHIFEGVDLNRSVMSMKHGGIIVNTIGVGVFRNITNVTDEDVPESLEGKNVTFKDDVVFNPVYIQHLSTETGGEYVHASSSAEVYKALHDVILYTQVVQKDLSTIFIFVAIFILLIEWMLRATKYNVL